MHEVTGRGWGYRLALAAVCASALAAALLVWWRSGWTLEDACITARSVRNLVRYGELSYNLGDAVSSTTSPLFALVAVPAWLGVEPLVAAKVVGLLGFVLAAALDFGSVRTRQRLSPESTHLTLANLLLHRPSCCRTICTPFRSWRQENGGVMAHGSKMISRVLEEADRAIATARYFAPDVAEAWGALRPEVEGNLAPDLSVYLETVISRIEVLRERLSSAHLHRSALRSRTLFQHDAVRLKADRLRYLLHLTRFQLDYIFGKGKSHANFEGRSDLQRIPIPQLERIAMGLLNLMRGNPLCWDEERAVIDTEPLCAQLEVAIRELQEARALLRSDKNAQSLAYGERFRSGAADEKELREKIDVVRTLLKSSGLAEEARELRRIRPRPRREASRRVAPSADTAAAAPCAPPCPYPQYLRELSRKRRAKRSAQRRRQRRLSARRPRLPGTS